MLTRARTHWVLAQPWTRYTEMCTGGPAHLCRMGGETNKQQPPPPMLYQVAIIQSERSRCWGKAHSEGWRD